METVFDSEQAMIWAVARDARGPGEGEGCVVRGGAFDSSPRHVRCAHRNWYYPFNARKNVGFRVAAAAL